MVHIGARLIKHVFVILTVALEANQAKPASQLAGVTGPNSPITQLQSTKQHGNHLKS